MEHRSTRRVADRSNADVRRLLQEALPRFGGWRSDLASISARASRALGDADREAMLGRCDAIAAELLSVRTTLLLDLADAPQKIAGHSRVVDVERALDGIEAQTGELRRLLG
jgi:hypothetical protein